MDRYLTRLDACTQYIPTHNPVPPVAEVGAAMKEIHRLSRDRPVLPDAGTEFQDFGDDSSDSGLESILESITT